MGDRLHIRLYGTVQGVGFRYFAAQTAARTGIIGYARNLPDGSVEVEAAGDTRALAQFRDALVQGPPYARVQRVETLPPGPEALGTRFEIRR